MMRNMDVYLHFLRLCLKSLCRQLLLPAVLIAASIAAAFLLGNAAEDALNRQAQFSGITLAVTAEDGDEIPKLLETYLGKMSDIRQYCTVQAMSPDDAEAALQAGQVTAVLTLPADFIQSVQTGINPAVRVTVDSRRPLESALTLWIGQSAADLLAAVQAGIYDVLAVYDSLEAPAIARSDVILAINLRYINWTLNRQELFTEQTISAEDIMPLDTHYMLSLLLYLNLLLSPVLCGLYTPGLLQFIKRMRALGIRGFGAFLAAATVGTLLMLPAPLAAVWLLRGSMDAVALGCVLLCALFCSAAATLLCTALGSTSRCAFAVFSIGTLLLGLSGGIVPPVLMGAAWRSAMALSPLTHLRTLLHHPDPTSVLITAGCTLLLFALSWVCFRRRVAREEAAV